MIQITEHCRQRLSERFLIDTSYKELNIIRRLIRTKYYVLIKDEGDRKIIITRYKGRYIKFVVSKDLNKFITALPYHENDLQYIEQFIKEFDE